MKIQTKQKLRNCFSDEALRFAVHPSDREEAAKLTLEFVQTAQNLTNIETEVRTLLTELFEEKERFRSINWDTANNHINEQVERVKEHYKPWVNS